MSEPGPSGSDEQERIARELADELRKLKVEDVLVNTLMTVSSIGYRRLGLTDETRGDRDLAQAQLAIETMRALTEVLAKFVPQDLVRDFNSSVANLQLAYAKAASEGAEPEPGDET
ncbi:MAG: hypothetical protein M3304_06490 [Actinomycetota bacterium]|nr:hypothetical protein [Actinomycetota bacterium]